MPKLKGFTKEQLAARALRLKKRYLKRNRERLREYNRALYRGTHRQWEINAFLKAGGVL